MRIIRYTFVLILCWASALWAGGNGPAPLYLGNYKGNVNITPTQTDGSANINPVNANQIQNPATWGTWADFTDVAATMAATITGACAIQQGSDGSGNYNRVGTIIQMPPNIVNLSYPIQLKCSGVSLKGAGRYSTILRPTYDFGPTIEVVGSGYAGLPTTTSLVTGAGNAANFHTSQNSYWLNLRDWNGGGATHAFSTCVGANVNGCTAFTAEGFVNLNATTDGVLVGSGNTFGTTTGEKNAFILWVNGGIWLATIKTSGCNVSASGPAPVSGTTLWVAETYDGSNVNLYVGAPGTSVTPTRAACTGTMVQDVDEDVTIGPVLSLSWPNGSIYLNSLNGVFDSVRLSSIARYTGAGSVTAPSAKFSADANTLILTNFEKDPNGINFKAYDAGGGSGWLFPYNTNRSGPGGVGMTQNHISDFAIHSAGAGAPSGIILDDSHDETIENIVMSSVEWGIQYWNLAFENFDNRNLDITSEGRYGIINNSVTNFFSQVRVTDAWSCFDNTLSGGHWNNAFCVPNGLNTAYLMTVPPGGGGGSVQITNFVPDLESTNSVFKCGIYASQIGVVDLSGGIVSAADKAPAICSDAGANFTLNGVFINSVNNGGADLPTEIVHVTGSPLPTITFNGVDLNNSGWSTAPLSLTANAVVMTPCQTIVTLSSGSGTASNVCIQATSKCSAIDTTTFANSVTLAAPAAGSVALSSGTGSDVIRVVCQ